MANNSKNQIVINRHDWDAVIQPLLVKRQKEIKVQLAKITLFMDAIERESYEFLSPALLDEFNQVKTEIDSDKTEVENNVVN